MMMMMMTCFTGCNVESRLGNIISLRTELFWKEACAVVCSTTGKETSSATLCIVYGLACQKFRYCGT